MISVTRSLWLHSKRTKYYVNKSMYFRWSSCSLKIFKGFFFENFISFSYLFFHSFARIVHQLNTYITISQRSSIFALPISMYYKVCHTTDTIVLANLLNFPFANALQDGFEFADIVPYVDFTTKNCAALACSFSVNSVQKCKNFCYLEA